MSAIIFLGLRQKYKLGKDIFCLQSLTNALHRDDVPILCTFCAQIWTNCTTLIRCHQIVCIFIKILRLWKSSDWLKNQECKLCFLFYVWWAGRPCLLLSLTATWHHHWRLILTLWKAELNLGNEFVDWKLELKWMGQEYIFENLQKFKHFVVLFCKISF